VPGPKRHVIWLVAVALMAASGAAEAQLNTQHLKGGVGLKAGSQPPPHTYIVLPLVFVYKTNTIRNNAGAKLPIDASISSAAYGAGIALVTDKKIFGGLYGIQVLFPVGVNNRLQGTEIDQNPGGGLTDSVVQPISLGWHFKRADAIAAYTLYVPTGRYEDGAQNNTGFGMWANEISVGTTVYLNAKRQYHAATLASVSFQSKKEDSETKVGNMLVLEGGVGGDFSQGRVTAGLAYAAGFKLSEDRIDGLPEILAPGKNKSFALGPEVSFVLESKGTIYGFLKVNYEWETYARNTTQGNAFEITATFPFGPIKLPGR
jgi:hypothetical protein